MAYFHQRDWRPYLPRNVCRQAIGSELGLAYLDSTHCRVAATEELSVNVLNALSEVFVG